MSVFAPKYKILTTQTTFTKIYVSFVPVFNEATLKYCIINSKLKLISNTEQYVKHDFELFEKNSGRDTSRTLYVYFAVHGIRKLYTYLVYRPQYTYC